jgi:hypothetical protein
MRATFEVVSGIRDHLDSSLVLNEITYSQWVDATRDTLEALGWSEKEFSDEIDRRWLVTPSFYLIHKQAIRN